MRSEKAQRRKHSLRGARIVALIVFLSACATAPAPQTTAGFEKSISFSILEDYDKGEDLKEVESDFRLFRELGVTTWRGSFGWDDYEPVRGQYDFAWLHQFVGLAARYEIRLRPYVAYTPDWAARIGGQDSLAWNNPPADHRRWYRFMLNLATAMKRHSHVLSFEIYNEENSTLWWDGSAGEYAQVLKSGSEAVQAAGGDDQVLIGGLTYPDAAWLERICGADDGGQSFHVLAIHAYPETWPEQIPVESYLDQTSAGFEKAFLTEADRACGKKPIWINEAGFATTPGRRTERDQANWWARAIATFVADRRIEHIGIYEIKDRPRTADVIGEPENYYLGLTRADRTKKLAFYTVKRLVQLLNTGTLTAAEEMLSVKAKEGQPGALYHHLFVRPDGRRVVILWDKYGSPVVDVRLAQPGASATEYMLSGASAVYGDFDGRTLRNVRLAPDEARIFEIL